MEFGLEIFNSLQQKFNSLTIEDWKNLSNIVFFISATLVAWFSYAAAKKSLLSPMKNEILKFQLDDIKEVLQFFRVKYLTHYDENFDINGIVNLNIKILITMYLDAVFNHENKKLDESIVIKNNKLKAEIKEEQTITVMAGEYTVTHLEMKLDCLTDAKYWDENYVVCGVSLTEKCRKRLEHLDSLTSSPLLPSDLIVLLEEYEAKMGSLYTSITDGLNDAKAKLNFKGDTVYEITNEKFKQLQQLVYDSVDSSEMAIQSEKIVEYVRNYLKVNKIMT